MNSGVENKKSNVNRFEVLGSIREDFIERMEEDAVNDGQGNSGTPSPTNIGKVKSGDSVYISNIDILGNGSKHNIDVTIQNRGLNSGVGNKNVSIVSHAFEEVNAKNVTSIQ